MTYAGQKSGTDTGYARTYSQTSDAAGAAYA